MNTIIFDITTDGHHLEYLHHIYSLCANRHDSQYVFLVPERFVESSRNLVWPETDNVVYEFIDSDDLERYAKADGYISKQKILSGIINRCCEKYNIYNVFLNVLMILVPYAPLYLNHKVRLSGIIYDIYKYQQELHSTLISKIPLWLCYHLMSHCHTYHEVFLLNDEEAPHRMNKKFRTNKFEYIADPYNPLPANKDDFHSVFGIPAGQKIYALIGAMEPRKGTHIFLDAINLLNAEELSQATFLYAGGFGRYYDEFEKHLSQINPKAKIIVHNQYCSYKLFASICANVDYLLVPYQETIRSSGIIGYAAQFGTPVIGPSSGLLGALIKKYELGVQFSSGTSTNLATAIRATLNASKRHTHSTYCESHSIDAFQNAIKSSL